MREPPFWWRKPGFAAAALTPFAALYGAVAARRLAQPGTRAAVPVICIGNPTVGGAGKTPAALAIAGLLREAGESPVFLSRGYGGTLAGPVMVDQSRHRAAEVGDEALLLAAAAPAIVARDRRDGAAAAAAAGASVIVMDDGFQNPSLAKDCALLVIDARRGLGNARVIPAGPLRAPLAPQLARAHGLIMVGGAPPALLADAGLPVFAAKLMPDPAALAALAGRRVLAFAGIGDPEKFFATLRDAGIEVVATRAFADHHRYSSAEIAALRHAAERDGLVPVTTEKDAARLRGDDAAGVAGLKVLPVTLAFDDAAAVAAMLRRHLTRRRA